MAILISNSCSLQVSESVIKPNGRYFILYRGVPLILCNTYVPNASQIDFLNSLLSKLFCLPPSGIIIVGHFNVASSEIKDTLLLPGRDPSPALQKLSRSFRKLICKFSLFDLWKIAHPTELEYFSSLHKSHSRIDYFLGNITA